MSRSHDSSVPERTASPALGWILALSISASLLFHLSAALLVILIAGSPRQSVQQTAMISLSDTSESLASARPVKADRTPAPPAPSVPEQTSDSDAAKTAQASSTAAAGTDDIESSPLGLGLSHGYVAALAEGATLRDDIRMYYFELVERVNREWWVRAKGLENPIRQYGIIEVGLSRDGHLTGKYIRQSTGSRSADRLLLEAVEAATPLAPLPESYPQDIFQVPLKISPPAFMFRVRRAP